MIADMTIPEFDSRTDLTPFCWKKYLEHIDDNKWCPSDLFSYDHMSPNELYCLSDQIEKLAAMLQEESEKILTNDYPKVTVRFDTESRQNCLLGEAIEVFEEATDEFQGCAIMMLDDAAYVRREIVKREWSIVSQRVQNRKQSIIKNEPD